MSGGFKDFTAGDVLMAADVDAYLSRQAIMRFASTAARDSALSGVLEEGLQTYQLDTNSRTFYNGISWQTTFTPRTSWVPTWTNLTVGNGTTAAYYAVSGDLVKMVINFTFGTTSAVTGSVSVATLPVNGPGTAPFSGGSLILRDASGSDALGQITVATSTAALRTSTGAALSSTVPFTWTTSDQILIDTTYWLG
jgi:hypothetical protein